MPMQEFENFKEVDLSKCIYTVWKNKLFCIKASSISLIIGIIVAFSIPPSYTVNVLLSPESGSDSNNNLSNMASMLGVNNLNNSNSDAINSSMFTEIVISTPFVIDLYKTKIPQNDSIQIPFYQYLESQKEPWWNLILKAPNKLKKLLTSSSSKNNFINNDSINPFKLNSQQLKTISQIKDLISAKTDKKNNTTTISVTLQDPEIAAIIANITVDKLQQYFTDYKTKKSKEDYIYLKNLYEQRKEEYYKRQQLYASFLDKNRNINSQQTNAESIRLQNEMEISYSIYNQTQTQLEIARAKIQESKPVFAIIEPASIPIYPSAPNKTLIMIGFIVLGFIISISWVLFGKNFYERLTNKSY